jgi:anaerobic ribonucleoside-triphosphate reductase activating protein
MTTDEVIGQMLSNSLTDGLTLSGGEPFEQAEDCMVIARAAHDHGLNVWCYTGYTYEHLLRHGTGDQIALLAEVDVLVDGRYIENLRSLTLPWRGSSNQRVIDMKEKNDG